MTQTLDSTVPTREIVLRIPTAAAQKMAETFEGTLEDAALAGLKLIHGMGMPAYTSLQELAKARETSVPKTLRAAIEGLREQASADTNTQGHPNTPKRASAGRPTINDTRDNAIYLRVTEGATYAEVAGAFGISLVRVGQIMAMQRAMRGINVKADTVKRNEDILRRLSAGESRQEVAASYGISRSVVDNLVSTKLATAYAAPVQTPEDKPLTLKVPEALAEGEAPTEQAEPKKPRFVMPSLEAIKAARAAHELDPRTPIERDTFDP
ncbi:MAG: hypothetical protein ACKO0Z_24775, partial [Betaproteobacteria bacterium]